MDSSEIVDIPSTTASDLSTSLLKSEVSPFAKGDPCLNFSQISKDRSDFGDNQEEILSKDTDTPDDLIKLEERDSPSSPSPSIMNKKIRKSRKSNLLADMDLTILTQPRPKRAIKKPVDTYIQKTKEEMEEKQKRQKNNIKKPKPEKIEEEPEEPETSVEKFCTKPRTEIGYDWREMNLAFNKRLCSLSSEEFVTFLKNVVEDKPECVSFDKGFAELKVSAAKVIPPLSHNTYSKANQMMVQNKTFMEFIGYIDKIKGTSSSLEKPKGRKNLKGKN